MAFKTITLVGDPIIKERAAHETITPGFLCFINSDNEAAKHAVEGGSTMICFALEDENQGKTIDDNYSATNVVKLGFFKEGDEVYGYLANGENVHIGDKLESKGNGYLKEVDTDASAGAIAVGSIVGRVVTACDASGGAKRVHLMISRG